MEKINSKPAIKIAKLAYPLIIANITIPLLAAVDTAVLGRLDNPSYLAAMAIGTTIFSYLLFAFNFLRSSGAALNAQAIGRDDKNESMQILYRALTLAIIIGLAILVIVQQPAKILTLSLFNTTTEVSQFWQEYYHIRILSVPAALANLVFIGWFLGSGNVYLTLITQALINILNIILDIILVLGLGFAMAGAAWATVIAEYCGVIFASIAAFAFLAPKYIKQPIKNITNYTNLKKLITLNLNVMLRTLLLITCIAWFTIQGAKLGTTILAVNAVLMNFFIFAGFALDGIADATQTLVGQQVGRKNKKQLEITVKYSFIMAFIMAAMFTTIYAISFNNIVAMLTNLPNIQQIAQQYSFWAIIIPLTGVACFVLDGIFLGLTQGSRIRNAMIASTISYFIIIAIAVPIYNNHGLWFSLNALLIVRALFLWLFYPKQYWT